VGEIPVKLARGPRHKELEKIRRRLGGDLDHHAWTPPGNRAISYSPKSNTVPKVTDAASDNWASSAICSSCRKSCRRRVQAGACHL
jgi:hypothetical protein